MDEPSPLPHIKRPDKHNGQTKKDKKKRREAHKKWKWSQCGRLEASGKNKATCRGHQRRTGEEQERNRKTKKTKEKTKKKTMIQYSDCPIMKRITTTWMAAKGRAGMAKAQKLKRKPWNEKEENHCKKKSNQDGSTRWVIKNQYFFLQCRI